MKTIPITLITGYLGSGKTTLLNNILTNDKGYKIAVIVNDIGEVNLDAELIQKGGVVNLNNDSLVALQNGCICCTLNKDLIKQILQLSQSGKFDHIMIEASGICEPMPIVQSIIAIEDECTRRGIPKVCRLDAVVCVTDALRLAKEFGCGKDLQKSNIDEEDIENLLIQQIEFCDVLLLNKADEISKEELKAVKEVVKQLQPSAVMYETNYAKVDLDKIVDTNLFEFEKSFNGAGWLKAMDSETEDSTHHKHQDHDEDHHKNHDEHDHDDDEHEDEEGEHHDGHHEHHNDDKHKHRDHDDEDEHYHHDNGEKEHEHHHEEHHHGHHHHHDDSTSEEYGISTFVYFRRTPMNREKFLKWANENWGKQIIRCKGLVYFEDDKDMSYLFEQAGTQKNLTESGLWYATMPKNELDQMLASDPMLKRDWDEKYGDRMIKLVFIGQHMDKEKIIETLNNF